MKKWPCWWSDDQIGKRSLPDFSSLSNIIAPISMWEDLPGNLAMHIYRIERSQVLTISVETAWKFFSSPGNLHRITPPWLNLNIIGSVAPQMRAGMLINYNVTPLFGLRMRWLSEITHVDAPLYFVDEQRLGPYQLWHHEHFFHACGRGVRVDDIVSYALKYAVLGNLIHAIWIKKRLQMIFDYRSASLRRLFGSTPETIDGG